MTKKIKINTAALTASVEEHRRQMCWHLKEPLHRFFSKLYAESLTKAEASSLSRTDTEDLVLFQQQLKLVPKWNRKTVTQIGELIMRWFDNRNFQLTQSLRALVVGRTMLMVAMNNANSEVDERVRVDIPNAHTFLHRAIEMVAMNLYEYPSLMRSNSRDTESEVRSKQQLLNSIIKDAIEDTITDRLSSASVLNYLDSMFQKGKFINDSVDLDEEDFTELASQDEAEGDSDEEVDAEADEGNTSEPEPVSGDDPVEESVRKLHDNEVGKKATLADTFDVEE
jgi:hypothetical protein